MAALHQRRSACSSTASSCPPTAVLDSAMRMFTHDPGLRSLNRSCCITALHDLLRPHARQTFERHGARAQSRRKQGRHSTGYDRTTCLLAVGPRSDRIRRAEQRHHRRPHRRRDVHRPGVVRHQQAGRATQQTGQQAYRGLSRQINRFRTHASRSPPATPAAPPARPSSTTGTPITPPESRSADLGKVLRRPAFRLPTRRHVHRHPDLMRAVDSRRGSSIVSTACWSSGRSDEREPRRGHWTRRPQRLGHEQVPIDRVHRHGRNRHPLGVTQRAALPRRGKPDPPDRSRPISAIAPLLGRALVRSTTRSNPAPRRVPAPGPTSPSALPVYRTDPIDPGNDLHQRRPLPLHQPRDLGLGKPLAQRRQGRHRMHDVAQRARFDQQESAYNVGHSATRDDQRGKSAAGLCVAWATIQSTACDIVLRHIVRRQVARRQVG
jgi:hypothetical protein